MYILRAKVWFNYVYRSYNGAYECAVGVYSAGTPWVLLLTYNKGKTVILQLFPCHVWWKKWNPCLFPSGRGSFSRWSSWETEMLITHTSGQLFRCGCCGSGMLKSPEERRYEPAVVPVDKTDAALNSNVSDCDAIWGTDLRNSTHSTMRITQPRCTVSTVPHPYTMRTGWVLCDVRRIRLPSPFSWCLASVSSAFPVVVHTRLRLQCFWIFTRYYPPCPTH